jgi:peptidoglycan hydrolase-like amidase
MHLVEATKGTWEVDSRAGGCGGSGAWTKVTTAANPVAVPSTSSPAATSSQVLTLCRADGVDVPMRGDIQAVDHGGISHTVDRVLLEQYLRGVVPSEMPADWGTIGSAGPGGRPWGFQALEAQAVAARTYAITTRRSGEFDQYPDTRSQMYLGVAAETPSTDAAVASTRGQVVTYDGRPVTT